MGGVKKDYKEVGSGFVSANEFYDDEDHSDGDCIEEKKARLHKMEISPSKNMTMRTIIVMATVMKAVQEVALPKKKTTLRRNTRDGAQRIIKKGLRSVNKKS